MRHQGRRLPPLPLSVHLGRLPETQPSTSDKSGGGHHSLTLTSWVAAAATLAVPAPRAAGGTASEKIHRGRRRPPLPHNHSLGCGRRQSFCPRTTSGCRHRLPAHRPRAAPAATPQHQHQRRRPPPLLLPPYHGRMARPPRRTCVEGGGGRPFPSPEQFGTVAAPPFPARQTAAAAPSRLIGRRRRQAPHPFPLTTVGGHGHLVVHPTRMAAAARPVG